MEKLQILGICICHIRIYAIHSIVNTGLAVTLLGVLKMNPFYMMWHTIFSSYLYLGVFTPLKFSHYFPKAAICDLLLGL